MIINNIFNNDTSDFDDSDLDYFKIVEYAKQKRKELGQPNGEDRRSWHPKIKKFLFRNKEKVIKEYEGFFD